MAAGVAGVAAGVCVSAWAVGKLSALRFPSADIARAAGAAARAAAGRLLLFLRLLTVALCIVALAGPRFANDHIETEASGVDIMLALDLSWSMMALDMGRPSERVSRFDIASQRAGGFHRASGPMTASAWWSSPPCRIWPAR